MPSHQTTSVLLSLAALVAAQQPGDSTPETHPPITWEECTAPGACTTVTGSVVIDANWRWTHNTGGYANCYTGNEWNEEFCPDSATCTENCVIEGAEYASTYGVTTDGSAVTLAFKTNDNIGSRLYFLSDDDTYAMFTMNGNEIAFDVENSEIGCGLNGAVYFVSMDADGGKERYPTNTAGARYGTGYCDSQCARDLKWVGGLVSISTPLNNSCSKVHHTDKTSLCDRPTEMAGKPLRAMPTPALVTTAAAVPRWISGRPTASPSP